MGFPYRRNTISNTIAGFSPSIILYDDMEKTLKWVNAGNGGATIEKHSSNVYNDSYCILAKSETPDESFGDTAGMYRNIIVRPGSRTMIHQIFKVNQTNRLFTLEFKFEYIANGRLYTASLTYLTADDHWVYLDAGGEYAIVEGISHSLSTTKHHFFELIIDTRTHEFVSFTIDNVLAPMPNIKYKNEISAAATYGKYTILGTLLVGVDSFISIYLNNISIIAE